MLFAPRYRAVGSSIIDYIKYVPTDDDIDHSRILLHAYRNTAITVIWNDTHIKNFKDGWLIELQR